MAILLGGETRLRETNKLQGSSESSSMVGELNVIRGQEEARLERLERERLRRACATERFHISSQALRNVPMRLVSVSINAITRSLV